MIKISVEMKQQVEILAQKRLLSWLVLHRVSVKDNDYSLISHEINRLRAFEKTSQTIIRNYLVSLETSQLISSSYHRRRKTFTIVPYAKQYYLRKEGLLLLESLNSHKKHLDSLLLAETRTANYHPIPQINVRFLGRILTFKNVFPYYILDLLQKERMALSYAGIQDLLIQKLGWSCSSKAISVYIDALVECSHVEIITEDEQQKKFRLTQSGQSSFPIYEECAINDLQKGRAMLQELIHYILSFLNERNR
ncbi:hypothetical protein GN156_04340 [bacterium LRH843]|nr:hypothetical protein [bacterium LRH843]